MPILNALKESVIDYNISSLDATTLQVLNEPDRKSTTKSYVYCFRGGDPGKESIIYEYNEKEHKLSLKTGLRDFLVPCIRMLIHSLMGSMQERMFGHYSAIAILEENMKRSQKRPLKKALHMKLCVFILNSIK